MPTRRHAAEVSARALRHAGGVSVDFPTLADADALDRNLP
jgi:hypothetical protein